MNRRRLLARLTRGALRNVAFTDMVNLVEGFGFRQVLVNGSHHIIENPTVPNAVNLQAVRGEASLIRFGSF
jgi:predicted RNA binding protein YcfA (HicA-like mRNA interferase family)